MEAGTETITQADAEGLAEKLKTFVDTLTPGEQDALKMALAQSAVPEGDDTGGFLARRFAITTPWGPVQVDSATYTQTPWGDSSVQSLRR
jgi:hypothetical protein